MTKRWLLVIAGILLVGLVVIALLDWVTVVYHIFPYVREWVTVRLGLDYYTALSTAVILSLVVAVCVRYFLRTFVVGRLPLVAFAIVIMLAVALPIAIYAIGNDVCFNQLTGESLCYVADCGGDLRKSFTPGWDSRCGVQRVPYTSRMALHTHRQVPMLAPGDVTSAQDHNARSNTSDGVQSYANLQGHSLTAELRDGQFPRVIPPGYTSRCTPWVKGSPPNTPESEVIALEETGHYEVFFTGREKNGFEITPVSQEHFGQPLEISLEPLDGHFDVSSLLDHRTRDIVTERNFMKVEYCQDTQYPQTHLMKYMGPGQTALVVGDIASPRSLWVWRLEVPKIVRFRLRRGERVYLFFMHQVDGYEYMGAFGHGERFLMIVRSL